MRLDANVPPQVRRGVEQMLEQDDIFFVFMGLFGMAGDRPGDEDYFLRLSGRQADDGTKEAQQQERNAMRLAAIHMWFQECDRFAAADKGRHGCCLQASQLKQTFRRVESDLARGCPP